MGLTSQIADRLFRLGEFAELIASSDLSQLAINRLDPSVRLILAHALAFTGDLDKSRELVLADSDSDLPTGHRSRAKLVLGLVEEASGSMPEARRHFQSAVRLAYESRDDERVAWAYLHLLRHMIEGQPMDVVAPILSEVRRAVTRVGMPQTSAYLHQCVSVLEGQTGRLEEARRHCDIAESLLALSPNVWLDSTNLNHRACIAALSCKFGEALKYSNASRELAERCGLARSRAIGDSNIGHVRLMLGQYGQASQALARVIGSPRTSRLASLGASEGQARVHLARNELDECQAILTSIEEQAIRNQALASSYPVRWAAITNARLFLRQGKARLAADLLADIEERSREIRDTPFSIAIHVTRAQALARDGQIAGACRQLVLADQEGATKFRELQGQYDYAAAGVLSGFSPSLENHLRDRAERLWAEQGIVSLRMEMEDRPRLPESHTVTQALHSKLTPSIQRAIDSISSAVDLAYSPRLLGEELLAAIRACGSDSRAKVVESHGDADHESSDNGVTLTLGVEGHKKLTLVCQIPDDPEKAILLADVLRVGQAALDLERYRGEERQRAALWPASPVEEQAGALFIAEEMQTLLATARRIAPTNVPVLITGETGTGKEVLARLIHAYSTRAKASFLPFNCTSTPKDMLDSQLFGHRRGAFTGATEHFQGVIRGASGGTLFLDEIGDMSLEVQPKLLRFLESNEVHPIGETRPVQVDVRVIAATNAELDPLVSQGRFREDLLYRLNIVPLHVPPLRERRVEIPSLAHHYLAKYAHECRKGDLRLSEETLEYLVLYRWPGNVRQLANEMRRLAALAETGAVLMPEHLSRDIAASRRTIPASERVLAETEVVVRLDQPMPAAVQHVERTMLLYALEKCGGHMEKTAAMLGLSRKGLYLKRRRLGIDSPADTSWQAEIA